MREKIDWKSLGLLAVLHVFCCGIPLLLLSGVSFAFVVPNWPVLGGIVATLGLVGFAWYCKRRCPTCPGREGCSLTERSKCKP